ncbi:MAG: flavodoxin family protein [Mesorhizobium sp.]|uniref:NAD(P)H-dependent oxidoreductase n=1 Tax=Mesorhizobium sp. TaxID=1871066 RepID=UPI000FE62232|nr:NAD(P)H-dependent oxidoreductase [Mesorhizobium sp.]RWP10835.1 MAG: flavodoxin family protein [Mesorhizobium sp.]
MGSAPTSRKRWRHLCRALADSYADGAQSANHHVSRIDIAALDFPFLRTMEEFQSGKAASLNDAAQAIRDAEHIVFIFPLWLGTMPALLNAFLEQLMRPGIAFAGFAKTLRKGRSARVVVTMGMPAFFYRLWYLGHGVAGVRRNILNFVGVAPVRETLLGMVEGVSDAKRHQWLKKMRELGAAAR